MLPVLSLTVHAEGHRFTLCVAAQGIDNNIAAKPNTGLLIYSKKKVRAEENKSHKIFFRPCRVHVEDRYLNDCKNARTSG